MPDRYMMAVPLPHGRDGNTGFMSIYFSPRLVGGGTLNDYPDWKNWPAARGLFNLQVFVNGVQRNFNVVSAAPSSTKWLAVFPTSTTVKKWQFVDRTFTQLKTFDENGLTNSVRDM